MKSINRTRLWFGLLGAASAALYLAAALLVRSDNSEQDMVLFIGVFLLLAILWGCVLWLARCRAPRLWTVLAFAIVFRVLLLPAGYSSEEGRYQRLILYDDDVWRYLWEGHAWSAGLYPLRTPPADLEEYALEEVNPELHAQLYDEPAWGGVFDNIGYREIASPYPLAAHALFRLAHSLAPGSILGWKLLMMLFDLGSILLVMRLAQKHALGSFAVLAYAWNPLVIKEFAGSGHLDAALVFLILLAVSVPRVGSISLALATLVKPVALLIAPALVRRNGWKAALAPLAALVAFLWYLPRGLVDFTAGWTFNPALYRIFPLPRPASLAISALILGAIAFWWFRHDDRSEQNLWKQCVWLFGALLLLTPMFAPWYLTWLLPFAALLGSTFWLALSGSIFLSYHTYLEFAERPFLVLLQFIVPFLVWWWVRLRGKQSGQESAETGADPKMVLSLSSMTAAVGGLCCLTPIVLVLLGLANLTFAASFGDVLYGEYRWAFRLVAAVFSVAALIFYFRKRGVCSLSEARRRRNSVINVSLLVMVGSATMYIFWTYVVLHYWGISAGLPWEQYDESWAVPATIAMLLVMGFLYISLRASTKRSVAGMPLQPPTTQRLDEGNS